MLAGVVGTNGVAGAEQGRGVESRLGRAAHQFEAMMMKELLEPVSRPSALFEDGNEGGSGVLGQFASESLAGALSAGGGFGIAERIVHSISHSGNSSPTLPVTGKSENNTGISTGK
jgi:Rod binding domain-containing protein